MTPQEIYEKIRELQALKDSVEEKIKDYKNQLDSQLKPERDPAIKIVPIPQYISGDTDAEKYLSHRYPTYDVLVIDGDTARIQEKESYVPKKIVFDNGGQFYRRVSHGKPTINLNLLQKNYPFYYDSIIKMVPEIDEIKLNEKLENDPDFLSAVEEVLEMIRPSVALVATKSSEEE
jgi:hypothetical protein